MDHQTAIKALNQLRELTVGWDSYDAEPPSELALHTTNLILDKLQAAGLSPHSVIPTVEGGVGIVFINGTEYADIECFNDGEILAGIPNNGKDFVWEVAIPKLHETIQKIRNLDETIEKIRNFVDTERG